jgi:hypothetical protein
MPPSHLQKLSLEYDADSVLPDIYTLGDDPIAREDRRQLAQKLNAAIIRLRMVSVFFRHALAAAKIEMKHPPVNEVQLFLSKGSLRDRSTYRKILIIFRNFDPLELLEIPYDAKSYGEFAIECWEWATKQLEAETDFPAQFVRDMLQRFRRNDYAVKSTLKPQKIVGSKAKARIHGVISCVHTVLKMEVSYRGKPLFERTIWESPAAEWVVAYQARSVLIEDGRLKVRGTPLDPMPEASFALDTLPEEFLKTLD